MFCAGRGGRHLRRGLRAEREHRVFENLAQYSRSLETMRAELEKANASAEADEANATTRRDDSRPRDPPVGRLYPSHGDVIRDGSKKLEQYAEAQGDEGSYVSQDARSTLAGPPGSAAASRSAS